MWLAARHKLVGRKTQSGWPQDTIWLAARHKLVGRKTQTVHFGEEKNIFLQGL
jgi:hypothetical protein